MTDDTARAARKTMPAMAGVLLLLLGLGIGAVAATMVTSTINLRHAYPRAVMTLMNTHVSRLKRDVYRHNCDRRRSRQQLARVASLAQSIQAAFHAQANTPFMTAAARLHKSLVQARAAPLGNCAALAAALQPIDQACDACHRKFR